MVSLQPVSRENMLFRSIQVNTSLNTVLQINCSGAPHVELVVSTTNGWFRITCLEDVTSRKIRIVARNILSFIL